MVTISISAKALAAIAATLADDREAERRPDGRGGYFITLPRDVIDRLNYLRESWETYSDVILRLAQEAAAEYDRRSANDAAAFPLNKGRQLTVITDVRDFALATPSPKPMNGRSEGEGF